MWELSGAASWCVITTTLSTAKNVQQHVARVVNVTAENALGLFPAVRTGHHAVRVSHRGGVRFFSVWVGVQQAQPSLLCSQLLVGLCTRTPSPRVSAPSP